MIHPFFTHLRNVLSQLPKKILSKECLYLVVLVIFIYLASQALFQPGFFRTIDDITTVRIMYLLKELQRVDFIHNFPVRLSAELSHGFGYPLYLFYAPLPYYIGAILMMFAHMSHIVATKWVYVFPLIVGPLLFYWAASRKVDKLSAVVGACMYTLFPFRGYDTYLRGGVGEAWAMAFFPAIFAGIFLLERNNKYGGVIFSIFLSFTILSHNISALLIMGFIFWYGIIFRSKRYWKYFFIGIAMAAFFWLPSAYYLNIVHVNYSNQNTGTVLNFLEPIQNAFIVHIPFNPQARFSAITFYFVVGSLLYFLFQYKKLDLKKRKEYFFWSCSAIIGYLFLFSPTRFLWELTLPVSRILQFPWRLLIVLSFIVPFTFSLWVKGIVNTYAKALIILLLMLSTLLYLPAFKPEAYSFYYQYSAEDTGPCATSWGDEYLPLWVKHCALNASAEVMTTDSSAKITIIENKQIAIKAMIDGTTAGHLTVNKYYFPGWVMYIDGKQAPVDYRFSSLGVFRSNIPSGKHLVEVLYRKTEIMWFADILSLIACGYLLIEAIWISPLSFAGYKKKKVHD